MKHCILWFVCLMLNQNCIAQENRISFDLVISIDEEIAITLFKPVILVKSGSNILKKIDISYHPGNISLSSADYALLLSDQNTALIFQFEYYQYSSGGKQRNYNFEIEMNRNWFEQSFVILKIYNLDKRKYRKSLDPLSNDKNYTYDLESSQGQMIRIRKQ